MARQDGLGTAVMRGRESLNSTAARRSPRCRRRGWDWCRRRRTRPAPSGISSATEWYVRSSRCAGPRRHLPVRGFHSSTRRSPARADGPSTLSWRMPPPTVTIEPSGSRTVLGQLRPTFWLGARLKPAPAWRSSKRERRLVGRGGRCAGQHSREIQATDQHRLRRCARARRDGDDVLAAARRREVRDLRPAPGVRLNRPVSFTDGPASRTRPDGIRSIPG